jgi:hypothetical protein
MSRFVEDKLLYVTNSAGLAFGIFVGLAMATSAIKKRPPKAAALPHQNAGQRTDGLFTMVV